jgi:protein gp37
MATNSSIEWTEATWNPVTGCDKVSPGCAHCYAERMARRLQAMGAPNYRNGFAVTLQPQMLDAPLRWRRARRIFVNSMSDLFHADVPVAFISEVFDVMRRADWHQYQILTKRSERLLSLDSRLPWAAHIWMGVSVENPRFVYRIDHLRASRATVKFLALEPLLGPLPELDLRELTG